MLQSLLLREGAYGSSTQHTTHIQRRQTYGYLNWRLFAAWAKACRIGGGVALLHCLADSEVWSEPRPAQRCQRQQLFFTLMISMLENIILTEEQGATCFRYRQGGHCGSSWSSTARLHTHQHPRGLQARLRAVGCGGSRTEFKEVGILDSLQQYQDRRPLHACTWLHSCSALTAHGHFGILTMRCPWMRERSFYPLEPLSKK